MKETIQIDQTGRVVLPKPLRERFQLQAGDTLAVGVRGDAIELRPAQKTGRLKRVNGVLVFVGSDKMENDDLAAQSRDERIADLTRSGKIRP